MYRSHNLHKKGDRVRKPKIYLETTIFNHYFDTERDAHADDTVELLRTYL